MREVIVFDYDGTLVDNFAVKQESYWRAVSSVLGLPQGDRPAVDASFARTSGAHRFVQLTETLRDLGREATEEQREEFSRRFSAANEAARERMLEFPSARRTLEALRLRSDLVLTSGLPHADLVGDAGRRGLAAYFVEIEGGDKGRTLDRLREAGRKVVLFVGDTPHDESVAEARGVPFHRVREDSDLAGLLEPSPPFLAVLGSSGAVQSAARDNTSVACALGGSAILLDCPGSPYKKLLAAGIEPMTLAAVVLTHGHPDHVYGLPSLIHHLWMLAREEPLPVYAPRSEMDRLRSLLALFDLERRAGFVELRPLRAAFPDGKGPGSGAEPEPFWEHEGHAFFALPADHGPPAFSIRWDLPGGARVVYSGDTRPVEALAEFASGAALFVHEATYLDADAEVADEGGHTTAAQAARLAGRAGAERLLLVHLRGRVDAARWIEEARSVFSGEVEVPDDGAVYPVTRPGGR